MHESIEYRVIDVYLIINDPPEYTTQNKYNTRII